MGNPWNMGMNPDLVTWLKLKPSLTPTMPETRGFRAIPRSGAKHRVKHRVKHRLQ